MALFHLHVTQVKRSAGQSVVTSAAYRAGEKLYSEYYECVKDFATDLNGNGYTMVRKWFVAQFPNFRKDPLFYLNKANSPELIGGLAFLNSESNAPDVDEVEELAKAG